MSSLSTFSDAIFVFVEEKWSYLQNGLKLYFLMYWTIIFNSEGLETAMYCILVVTQMFF